MKTRGDEFAWLFFEQLVFPKIFTTIATANEILSQTKTNPHVFTGSGRYTGTPHVKNILLEHWRTLSEHFVFYYQMGRTDLLSSGTLAMQIVRNGQREMSLFRDVQTNGDSLLNAVTRAAYHEQLHEEFPNRSASVSSSAHI